jgi:ABC-2 type transport system ATP-binding protein
LLAGVLTPDAGALSVPGSVGWVPQSVSLYSRLTVAENLRLFARLERVADVEPVVERMLEQTRLSDRAGEPAGRLSAGNRQRLNIALGLLAEPAVLLLDEPTAALDPDQRERLWEFLGTLAQRQTTVLFSSHELSEVERRAGRVLVLEDGRLLRG